MEDILENTQIMLTEKKDEDNADGGQNCDIKENELLNSTCDQEKEEPEKIRTICEKIMYLKKCVTVEPIIALYTIPKVIASLATQNLNLDKACRVNLNYGDVVCDALKIQGNDQFKNNEEEVQRLITSYQIWKTIIQTSLPMILITFLGAWSDRTGKRKICIVMPIVGEFLVCISNLLNTYFFYEIPVEITMLLEGLLPALGGSGMTLLMGIFSYISDVTSTKSRTFRVGLVNLCMTAGWPVGTALSGVMVKYLGFYVVFSICGSVYLINIFYVIFILKESKRSKRKEREQNKFFKSLFDFSNLKETLTVVFKKREQNNRMKIIMMLSVAAIVYGFNQGENSVIYYYTRLKFNWDAVDFSMYNTFHVITHTSGALFSITVFNRLLKFDDSILGLISITSCFAGCLMKMFASNAIEMYMVAIVEILNATTFTSLRSIGSKIVPSEEMGKINSMLSLVETFALMAYDPFYSWLYKVTLHTFPAAVFVCSALMTIPAAGIFVWLYIQHRAGLRIQTAVA